MNEPAPAFDDPVGLLLACHQLILQHCAILERMPAHMEAKGVDAELQLAATRILRYFEISGPEHHADEELGLFPYLAAQPSCSAELRTSLGRLVEQHREMERAWQELAEDLRTLAASGKPVILRFEPFVRLNRAHIVMENEEIFPVARKLLDENAARSLGRAMAERRGLVGALAQP